MGSIIKLNKTIWINRPIFAVQNQTNMTTITVAKGDGIGPEIMDATLKIILAAGAQLKIEEVEVGEKVYLAGNTAGIAPKPGIPSAGTRSS